MTSAKWVSRSLQWFCLNCDTQTCFIFPPFPSSSMQSSSRFSFFMPSVCSAFDWLKSLWFLSRLVIGCWLCVASQSSLPDLLMASVWWAKLLRDWLQLWLPVELWLSRCGGGTEWARSKSRSLGQQVSEASTDITVTKPLLSLLRPTQPLHRKC